jgi:hypothetical protein
VRRPMDYDDYSDSGSYSDSESGSYSDSEEDDYGPVSEQSIYVNIHTYI